MTLPLSADQVGSFVHRKNAIINGDMRIAQRGTSFAAAASAAYNLDRWKHWHSGTAVHTITQDSSVPDNQFNYSLKFDCTTADAAVVATDYVQLDQIIEGYNFRKFVGQTATFSFWVKAGKTGIMCVAFRNGGVDRSYIAEVTIDSANTWEKKTVTLDFDDQGGTWTYINGIGLYVSFCLMAGTNWQTTADAWQNGNYFATVNQTNFADNTDATSNVWITGVQLELGSTATDFEFLDYEIQLSQCQRYYHRHVAESGSGAFLNGFCYTSTAFRGGFILPVKMRTVPTLNTGGTFVAQTGGANRALSTITISTTNSRVLYLNGIMTGGVVGAGGMVLADTDNSAYLAFDAEL